MALMCAPDGRLRAAVRRASFLDALAHRIEARLARIDMGEIEAAHVAHREFAEHVIEDRGRVLDRVVALHRAGRLEAGEGEGVDILLQRHAVLQAERHRDREVVDEGAQRRAFLVHVDEDLAEPAIVVFAGSDVNLMSAQPSLLRIARTAIRQPTSLGDVAMNDPLGDRMKKYELTEAGRHLLPLLPVVARLDGKGFSGFTRHLARPYDVRLSNLMVETTTYLVQETAAVCGYTQSDEITLAWYSPDYASQIYFDGRIQKMVSILAAKCSVHFNRLLPKFIPEKAEQEPVFDCRVWNLPTLEEAANAFLWREFDATKNSISMAAQEFYSHAQLQEKSSSEKQELLWQKGVNWNDYPDFFKRGSYIQRRQVESQLSAEDLEKLPPLHNARKNPNLKFTRTEYRRLELPPLNKVTNRVGVLFRGEEPQTAEKRTASV